MTEYDYSPAAYDRFMQTQSRISNWVSSQSNNLQSYPNPFVPSAYNPPKLLPQTDTAVQPSRSRSLVARTTPTITSSTLTRSRSKTHDTHSHKIRALSPDPPMSTRSRAMPLPGSVVAQHPLDIHLNPGHYNEPYPSNHHSTSSNDRSHRSLNRSTPSRPRSHSHSHSHHGNYHSPSAHTNSVRHRTVAYTLAPMDPDASDRKIICLDSNVVQLPPPREGEQYVIISPPGGTVQVLPMGSSSRVSGTSGDYDHDSEKRGRGKERTESRGTWVQRLFTSLTRGGSSTSSNPPSKSGSGSGHHNLHNHSGKRGHYRRSSF